MPNLQPGSGVQLTAELPGGTVAATEKLVPTGPFAASAPVWRAWLASAVLPIAGAATVFVRRNPPDEHLTAFERAVYAAAVPGEAATLAEVREAGACELVADTVRRG